MADNFFFNKVYSGDRFIIIIIINIFNYIIYISSFFLRFIRYYFIFMVVRRVIFYIDSIFRKSFIVRTGLFIIESVIRKAYTNWFRRLEIFNFPLEATEAETSTD